MKSATRWIVQAHTTGVGWVDCRQDTTQEGAEAQQRELEADASAWLPDTRVRRTRVLIEHTDGAGHCGRKECSGTERRYVPDYGVVDPKDYALVRHLIRPF